MSKVLEERVLASPVDCAPRRDFLRGRTLKSAATAAVSAASARAIAASSDKTDDLIFMSATQLARRIRAKQVSAAEAVEAFIARQLDVNDKLNAVVMNCYSRARKEAMELDAMAARGEWRGPLHGVPMTIKDSLDTEGVISTGATYGRQQYVPKKDATAVARVRQAGAILLGKTNTPEFTLGGLAGINGASNLLYGSTHNPYDLKLTPWSSSGGAGAIVAAGGAAFDIGSDWGGSIRLPSHVNGIAGIRPTSVRVPRTGHIVGYGGIFDLWQQLGPMCRRVEDISLITPIIAGPDFQDAACAPVPWADPNAVNLKQLKVAFFPDNGVSGADADTKKTVIQAAKWLEGATASVTEDLPASILESLHDARTKMTTADGWAFYQRIADRWGTKNIAPNIVERMKWSKPLSTGELVDLWAQHDAAKSRMLGWMSAYDVLICPVYGKPADPIDRAPGSAPVSTSPAPTAIQYTGTFSSLGWPVVVVRCGSSADGKLPIGVQVAAAPWREDICLAVASYLESKSGGWKRPPI